MPRKKVIEEHPNRVAFEGVLTLVDVPSDKAPAGARGHRVVLRRRAVRDALYSLRGMGVNYKAGWDGHDARQKVGVIEAGALCAGSVVRVRGYLFARDFPEVIAAVRCGGSEAGELGMSFEIADAHVEDMRRDIWVLNRLIFTGAAILLRARAAYRRTSFRLVGQVKELQLAASAPGAEMRSIVDEFEEDEVRDQD